jgi:hypothetical protein
MSHEAAINNKIFSPTITGKSLEARALNLGQFPVRSVEYSHQGEFSSICSICHEFPELHFVDLSVHAQIYLHVLFMGILYYLLCIPVTIHEI